jgi:hypothetical protein
MVGIVVPTGAARVVQKLNAEINRILNTPNHSLS